MSPANSDGAAVAAFAHFAADAGSGSFPRLARERAIDAITDCIGCILAGAGEPVAVKVRALLPWLEAPRGAWVSPLIGGGYASPSDAARFHGAAAHALDFDDTNHPAYAHPSAVLVSALLAVAPLADATGEDFVTAYIVGFDLMGKLGRALNTGHYARGWHATNTFGSLAAALAVSRLLRLSEAEIATAIGIAASMAGGIRANFGTMVKPLHAGLAARAGVEACLLAREGFTAADDALEHRFGYLAVFAGAESAKPAILQSPGEPLEILTEYGLALKPYPACGATHPGIEAALRLRDRLRPGEAVSTVRVGIAAMAKNPLIYDRPKTGLEGKFSMEFCAAAALLDGKVDLSTFRDDRVTRSDAVRLVERTEVEIDARVRESPEFATVVAITTDRGREDEELVPLAIGKPERWMSRAAIAAKFRDCAAYGGQEAAAGRLLLPLEQLDTETPLSEFLAGVAGPTTGAGRRSRGLTA